MGLHDVRAGAVTVFVLLVLSLVPLAIVARGIWGVWRFARLAPAAKRHYLPALWARFRWRWLTHNLGLTYEDRHRRGRLVHMPGSTAVKVRAAGAVKLRHPRAKVRADEFGLVATVKTVPKVARGEFEKNADHIANAWKCHRVQVSQPKPGRIIVRGLRIDPLTLPFGADEAPAGVFDPGGKPHEALAFAGTAGPDDQRPRAKPGPGGQGNRHGDGRLRRAGGVLRSAPLGAQDPWHVYLGRDEWAADRWLSLRGLTGITIGGLPGYGKTSLVLSLLMQLSPLPVKFVFIDGKGGGDYADWEDRAWLYAGDELPAAAAALEDAHQVMRNRFTNVLGRTGYRNAWHRGPTEDFPLIVTVIDECHTFFDLDAVKGVREAEAHVRTCRTLAGQLVKKGRSVLMLTILITQKQTGDAIPTAIRDNCGFGLSFAVKTKDAAVASLGDHIREYPGVCPTTLQDPAYVGVCTAALRTGQDPFVRLRVPEVSEEAAAARAAETAWRRQDPSATPALVPGPGIPAPAESEPDSSEQGPFRDDVPMSR